MTENLLQADVVIAGAGLAGLIAAHELLDHGKSVLLLDKDVSEIFLEDNESARAETAIDDLETHGAGNSPF